MKICHVITSLESGGAEATLYNLCRVSRHHVQHVVICLQSNGKYGPLLLENGITVETLDMSRGKFSFRSFFKLCKTIKKHKPDAVQTWMYHADFLGGLAARIVGVKNIFWGIQPV